MVNGKLQMEKSTSATLFHCYIVKNQKMENIKC